MVVVSVTPELALDEFPVFAGGLGILEGDKFNAASRSGDYYVAISPFYRKGYATYEHSGNHEFKA